MRIGGVRGAIRAVCAIIICAALCRVESRAAGGGLFHKRKSVDESTRTHAHKNPEGVGLADVARQIDELDRELFREGTIGVKSPDVWGQNRLTRHRVQFEKEMASRLGDFKVLLNGAMRKTDVAALTSATSVGAAITPGATSTPSSTSGSSSPISGVLGGGGGNNGRRRSSFSPVIITNINTPQPNNPPQSAPVSTAPSIPTPGALATPLLANIAARLDNLEKSTLNLPNNVASGVALEPNIQLDEQASYLYHLNELRRINVGDDLTDLPGYGLYLVRIPISLLPGPESSKGKGAIVTVEARHTLTPDLLPQTFGDAVVVEASYQLQAAMSRYVDLKQVESVEKKDESRNERPATDAKVKVPKSKLFKSMNKPVCEPSTFVLPPISTRASGAKSTSAAPAETVAIFGEKYLQELANILFLGDDLVVPGASDILNTLQSELTIARLFIREQASGGKLAEFFSPAEFVEFDKMVVDFDIKNLDKFRDDFLNLLVCKRCGYSVNYERYLGNDKEYQNMIQSFADSERKPLDYFVFALMAESVILNRQLRHDIAIVFERAGRACPGEGLNYYDPIPSDEARRVFNEYVELKWPLHVFTIDPVADQQNMLDVFSMRSELQMALAVAVASGNVNIDQAISFARRLDTDLVTIGLRRTAVGFGAGETTFGWKFFPRIQTPPTQSNLARIGGLLTFGGPGPNYIDKNLKIEPGSRECYAIIVAPDFIPAIELTSVADWFDLTGKHANQMLNATDNLALSRKVQETRRAFELICDSDQYRPGELNRLARRLEQLEAFVPSQTYRVPLPDEGDLLGFDLFRSDHARLEPWLIAWYGKYPKEGVVSSVFFLGKGFSVLNTHVIVGGVDAKFDLLSRNVMEVTIDPLARPIKTSTGRLVFDAHIATPNGISNNIFINVEPASTDQQASGSTNPSNPPATKGSASPTKIETSSEVIILPPGTSGSIGVVETAVSPSVPSSVPQKEGSERSEPSSLPKTNNRSDVSAPKSDFLEKKESSPPRETNAPAPSRAAVPATIPQPPESSSSPFVPSNRGANPSPDQSTGRDRLEPLDRAKRGVERASTSRIDDRPKRVSILSRFRGAFRGRSDPERSRKKDPEESDDSTRRSPVRD
jgi:hypothetical protein